MFRTTAATFLVTFALLAGLGQARADGSGSLVVRGEVQTLCTVAIQDMNARLDLTGGANNVTVGRVTETCNDPDGYTVTFSSQGGGKLVNGKAGVGYTVSYDGASDRSLAGALVLNRKTAAFDEVRELKVSVPAGTDRVAGNYADVITVTIAAN